LGSQSLSRLGGSDLVDQQGLNEQISDPALRVEGSTRVLKHDLYAASIRKKGRLVQSTYSHTSVPDRAGCGPEQTYQQPGERRLAATGLPDHRERFAPVHMQVHTLNRLNPSNPAAQRPARDRKVARQCFCPE
jgi:hypothetical protein